MTSSKHYGEEDLILHFYGEGRRRADVDRHLDKCEACAAAYRDLAATLRAITPPPIPERGEQYGLEVWQRIRYQLPEPLAPWWMTWLRGERLAFVAGAAVLIVVAFVAGRFWANDAAAPAPTTSSLTASRALEGSESAGVSHEIRQRILLTSVADHLDRSDRVLTDIMNAPGGGDLSAEQRWADDLLTTSRLYRQDALEAGEQSIASVLDELERGLLEIVHTPSKASAADLEHMRRRIDAAALLFKVRVMTNELRQRELPPPAESGKTT